MKRLRTTMKWMPQRRLKIVRDEPVTPVEPEWRAWYKTARWQKLRRKVLLRDGYICQKTGVPLVGRYPAENSPVVDHIEPHRGDPDKFWDEANLHAVSKKYHDGEKKVEEQKALRDQGIRRGYRRWTDGHAADRSRGD